jgi:hypothetical protein
MKKKEKWNAKVKGKPTERLVIEIFSERIKYSKTENKINPKG